MVLLVGCGSLHGSTQPSELPVLYHNAQYGFTFFLPASWQGYSVLIQQWEGQSYSSSGTGEVVATERGPIVVLRHPQWKANDPYQDIPIMVFTRSQWEDEIQGNFFPYAGGVIDEMWHNSKYVFGIYSRYSWYELKGWQEVGNIVTRNCAAHDMTHLHPH